MIVNINGAVLNAGKAVGLLGPDGNVDAAWFQEPADRIGAILTDDGQRQAFLDLLDDLIPGEAVAGQSPGEEWHPLLGDNPHGNLYLTVKPASDDGVIVGLAGDFRPAGPNTKPSASISAQMPLALVSSSGVEAIAGKDGGPLAFNVRVLLGWQPPAIGLKAVNVRLLVAPVEGTVKVEIVLEGLDLSDGKGAKDTKLDPDELDEQALKLVLGLIKQKLQQGAPGAEAAATAAHLLQLVGLDGAGVIPPLPFDQLLGGPAALQAWLNKIITQNKMTAWLAHLAGLFGSSAAVTGAGTAANPWTVAVGNISGGASRFDLKFAVAGQKLHVGLRATLAPTGDNTRAAEVQANVLGVPLAGAGAAGVLTSASFTLRAGTAAAPLAQSADVTVETLRAGIEWDGTRLAPRLDLIEVDFGGEHYDKLDLTNTNSVAAAATAAVENLIKDALGNGAQAGRLLALAGLADPASDPAWPHHVHLPKLVADPARAIAMVHRDALLDAAHGWQHLFGEVAALLGLNAPVEGAGTPSDPWRVAIDASGSLTLSLAAWNAQTSADAAAPQQLRLGLRLAAGTTPWSFSWLAELLSFDLPQAGAGDVRLAGGHHAAVRLDPGFTTPPANGVSVGVGSFGVFLDWSLGSPLKMRGVVTNLAVTADGATTTVPSLAYPPPAPFDVTNPAASLGIDGDQLRRLVAAFAARASATWAGVPGLVATALFGLHKGLPGLPQDFPTLGANLPPGAICTDLSAALRAWALQISTGVALDGTPFSFALLPWLHALLKNELPTVAVELPGVPLDGHGTYESPWTFEVAATGADAVELLTWLEPDGPPKSWASAVVGPANAATRFAELIDAARQLGAYDPKIRAALEVLGSGSAGPALSELALALESTDGLVRIESQVPTGGTWTAGTPLGSPHHRQPGDPEAIAQIASQLDAWTPPAGPRCVLLLGPAFSDHTAWDALRAAANAQKPGSAKAGAHFNLRVPNSDPLAVDLGGVTAISDYYTADLQDDGVGNHDSLAAQINRVVERIQQLRPGLKVTLVAHSTAGIAARAFAAAHPAQAQGLITVGTPHAGSALLPLRSPAITAAVRAIDPFLPHMPASALKDVLLHIREALDGYAPPPAPDQLAVARPYPVGSFSAPGDTDTAGVPALALGSTDLPHLFAALKQSIAATAAAIAAAPSTQPTHVAFGVRSPLPLPAANEGEIAVDASVRVDASRVALQANAPEPARPKHAVTVGVRLYRACGWLAGAPQSFVGEGVPPSHVRVRWAELGARLTPAGNDVAVAPFARLYQAAFHGVTYPVVDSVSPVAAPLIGEVFRALSALDLSGGASALALIDAFTALGLTVPDLSGGFGLSADAFNALLVDAAAYLGPKLPAALSMPSGFLGFSGPAAGPWTRDLGGGAFRLSLARNGHWTLGLKTTSAAPVKIAGDLAVALDARLSVPSFAAELDATLRLGAVSLLYEQATGQLKLAAPPWVDALTLKPKPTPAALAAVFNDLVPRLLLSATFSALLENVVGPAFQIGALDRFIARPAESFARAESLGTAAGALSGDKLNQLLDVLRDALNTGAGPGLPLPGGLLLTASGADTLTLRLETTAPVGGVLDFQLDTSIDSQLHATPAGSLSLAVAGLTGGNWGDVTLGFGVGPGGVTLTVDPANGDAIQLLPTFSGLGALAGGAAALLPAVLDEVLASLPLSQLKTLTVNVAEKFGLADPTKAATKEVFSSKSDAWKSVLQGDWLASFSTAPARQSIVQAVAALFTTAGSPFNGLGGGVTPSGSKLTWTLNPASGSGSAEVALGWDAGGPTFKLSTTDLKMTSGPLALKFGAGREGGQIKASVALAVSLQPALGVNVTPVFSFGLNGAGLSAHLYPLGTGAGALDVELLPTPGVEGNPGLFVKQLLAPLLAGLLVKSPTIDLNKKVWSTGPTIKDALVGAKIIDGGGNVLPLTSLDKPVIDFLKTLATNAELSVGPKLKLKLVNETIAPNDTRLGVRFYGEQSVTVGDIELGLSFGAASWLDDPQAKRGVTLYLFGSSNYTFKPLLQVVGLGVSFSGAGGSPLVNTSWLRLGGAAGYLFFDLPLTGSADVTNFGAGVELTEFGLPLGQALGGSAGGDNPVAASLLQSDGAGGGDPQPVDPAVDVLFVWRSPSKITFKIAGSSGAFWIGVRRSFGPVYIEQIGVEPRNNGDKVALLVDGMVKVSGLTVGLDDLAVVIPIRKLTTAGEWELDLRGLAVGYQAPGLSIAGGLLKNPGPPVQYDGMLQVDVAGRGFTAVGSYARPKDELGEYTSLFIFVSVPLPLGGPPPFFVLGLGGGAGFNRRLIVPTEITEVPNFLLVSAIDNPTFANDPMAALKDMAVAMPPKRGSFWFAAGVRFTSFVLVQTTAVVYVALDRGFEIGILGVSRMALPSADFAIASVELALKARYSSAEGILSIQAQLTENSYLFHPSCQLTGGFAFFIWFPQGQFLLTLGGYHPAFQKRPEFPVVPRLGFRWSFGPVTIKGEAYFALTNTCVMAGGRLEAVFKAGPIRAWFIAYTDILVSWDPFHYDIRIGVEVGIAVEFEVCFIGCVTIRLSLTRGADVWIVGPPLYAEVTVDAYITTITIPIGDKPNKTPDFIENFGVFKKKYLTAGDQTGKAVGVKFTAGLIPPEPPGAQPAPGSKEQPWRVAIEFAFETETRMAASTYASFLNGNPQAHDEVGEVDIAPMGKEDVTSTHRVLIYEGATTNWPDGLDDEHFAVAPVVSLFPEATWNFVDPAKVKAASNTVPVISGLRVTGSAVLEGQSAEIQIVGVVDDLPDRSLPLPFATNTDEVRAQLIGYGAAAADLFASVLDATTAQAYVAAELILTDASMAGYRAAAGIPAQGIAPLAKQALKYRRSAPPLVAPLTTGLTMEPVGLDAPPLYKRVGETAPVFLRGVRLAAVLQKRPKPSDDAPASLHTSVTSLEWRSVPRTAPPRFVMIPWARLHRVPAPHAPRPTEAAVGPRVLHNAETGVLAGKAHNDQFARAADEIAGEGVRIPAGTTHVWELPKTKEPLTFVARGDAALRVTFLTRGGRPVSDAEYLTQHELTLTAPRNAAAVAFSCLGKAPTPEKFEPGPGAITADAAGARTFPAAGWESGYVGDLVSSSTLLARGALVTVPRVSTTRHRGQSVSLTTVRAGEIAEGQHGAQTWLPRSIGCVMILLDGRDPTAASRGDLAIAVEGGRLSSPPVPIGGGRRRALLYDVDEIDEGATHLRVSVGSGKGWQLAGVVGLRGKSIEWVNRLHGGVPERMVAELPLTPDGSVNVRLVGGEYQQKQGG